jgi:hypothetical protein
VTENHPGWREQGFGSFGSFSSSPFAMRPGETGAYSSLPLERSVSGAADPELAADLAELFPHWS